MRKNIYIFKCVNIDRLQYKTSPFFFFNQWGGKSESLWRHDLSNCGSSLCHLATTLLWIGSLGSFLARALRATFNPVFPLCPSSILAKQKSSSASLIYQAPSGTRTPTTLPICISLTEFSCCLYVCLLSSWPKYFWLKFDLAEGFKGFKIPKHWQWVPITLKIHYNSLHLTLLTGILSFERQKKKTAFCDISVLIFFSPYVFVVAHMFLGEFFHFVFVC